MGLLNCFELFVLLVANAQIRLHNHSVKKNP